VRLQTEAPLWVRQAIIDSEVSVPLYVWAVHRLEVKECEGKAVEPFGLGPRLGEGVRSLWCALFERFCHPVSPAEAGVLDGVVAGDRNLLENAVSGRRNGGDYVNHPPARTRQWLTLSNWP